MPQWIHRPQPAWIPASPITQLTPGFRREYNQKLWHACLVGK